MYSYTYTYMHICVCVYVNVIENIFIYTNILLSMYYIFSILTGHWSAGGECFLQHIIDTYIHTYMGIHAYIHVYV